MQLQIQTTRLEDYFDFQREDDIRLKSSRVGIEHILFQYLHKCKTPEEITDYFKSITLEQVYATILYYLHHKEIVSKYMENWIDHGRQMRKEQELNPSHSILQLRKRLAKQKELTP